MTGGRVHIIGAGLSGLAAAISFAGSGREIVLHELARHAGGRCRSYFEPALGLTIDNGNHLLLSANHAALGFLKTVGSEDRLVGPQEAEFAFADLATGERWTLRPNSGVIPWWLFSETRRVPGTHATDYLPLLSLFTAGDQPIASAIACEGLVYERFARPVLLAALNTEPREASARLAGAVMRETLLRGGGYSRPLMARDGLGAAFIDPALRHLDRNGVTLRFDHQLRRIEHEDGRIAALDFGEDSIALAQDDAVILAVQASVAPLLLPEISAPNAFRAIANIHFKVDAPGDCPPITGIVNGTSEWLFAFPGRLSVTISAADRFLETPREELANSVWSDIAKLTGLGPELPPWCIVKERRATFAALPEQNARRPQSRTRWRNLFLAGDWTATGLPATIEGAIRSGNCAAELVRRAA